MNVRGIAAGAALAALASMLALGVAEARNPHCAGGIQYGSFAVDEQGETSKLWT